MFDITYNMTNFTGEIGELDHSLNGYTPALLSFLLVYNLNGGIMAKRIDYLKGQVVSDLIFIEELNPRLQTCGVKTRYAIFKCKCGNEFKYSINAIRRGLISSCGCKSSKERHGLTNHKLYKVWAEMKDRCHNKNSNVYKRYGGRGIKVCDEWRNSFKKYYDYVTNLKNYNKEGYSLDRINNNDDYKSGNMRWADRHTQITNRNISKNNKSGFVGVNWHKITKKWQATITVNKKRVSLGYFHDKGLAVHARYDYILRNNLTEYLYYEDYFKSI